ncbi:GlxA family transcriptional regulator [Desulfovibrio sp. JC010]|uniref:GlxA family transcriptional regulator n=1 Tax=Desulfovibrio sp. JC010 TaxID=2593641 RepID=UPI0013D4F41A|nr:helix-turn-helix domain-containing protein [Desulfovibrio sp. JC010]NDV25192.1 helix-turn-helix domain-containing protein [Desulfovibrio sp. JC010]
MKNVAVLAYDDCLVSAVSGVLEIFSIANTLTSESSAKDLFAGLKIVSPDGKNISGYVGIPLQVCGSIMDIRPDILVIPPVFGPIDVLLENEPFIARIAELEGQGTILASACAGSFLVARAGLLDGKPATTHWKLAPDFSARFAEVDLQPRRMLIDGGGYICAGGAMAWQDLALHIVARFMGREVAADCAKILVMDSTRDVQTPYFMFDNKTEESSFTDKEIGRVQEWMQENYHLPASTRIFAEKAGLGERTFLRRFKKATGMTPNNYLQQLRIEAARHLLEVSSKGVEEITARVGYDNPSSFRRLFKSMTGLSPREYRTRFSRME